MEQILVEIAGETALLYRLQRYGLALLDFEDQSLSVLRPRMVLLFRMLPELRRVDKSVAAQLANEWCLHRG